MTRAEIAARTDRMRSVADVEADLQLACRSIGALAGAAKLAARPIDRQALTNATEGLRRLLVEARAQEACQ